MKSIFKIAILAVAILSTVGFVSCSNDEFTPSIYDTTEYPLDQNSYTFPLDSFVKREFLQPYNLRFIHRMEDVGSDMDKNLTPAPYDKAVQLAALTKWVWSDCYATLAGEKEVFLKKYSPRIIHVIGSKNYNPTQGTETLGVAEGGIKISLYNVNNLDVNDISMMNQYFFNTMHHEFAHILDQTYLHPTSFNLISNSMYDAMGWADTPDSVSIGKGFVSSYASSAVSEDWVETLALYVGSNDQHWNQILGTSDYEWELIDCEDESEYLKKLTAGCDLDTIGYFKKNDNGEGKIYRRRVKRDANDNVMLGSETKNLFKGTVIFKDPSKIDNPAGAVETWTIPNVDWTTVHVGSILKISGTPLIETSDDYRPGFNLVNSDDANVSSNYSWDTSVFTMEKEIVITQSMLDKILATEDKSLTISGKSFIINNVQIDMLSAPEWIHDSGVVGREVIMKKLDLVRTWLMENYQVDLDALREMVQERMYVRNPDGTWALDSRGRQKNRFIEPEDGYPRLIDKLTDEIYRLKK